MPVIEHTACVHLFREQREAASVRCTPSVRATLPCRSWASLRSGRTQCRGRPRLRSIREAEYTLARAQLSAEYWTGLTVGQRKSLLANEYVRVALADAEVEVARCARRPLLRSPAQTLRRSATRTAGLKL